MKVYIYLTKNRISISEIYDLDIPYNDDYYYYQDYYGGGEKLYLITTNPNLGDSYFDNISSTTYYNRYGNRPVWFRKIGEEDLDWVDEEEFYSILNGTGWVDNSSDPFVAKYLYPIYQILEKYAREKN